MRLLLLLSIVVCVQTAKAHAQVGHHVVVSQQHQAYLHHGANPYGCCENDVSYAFDLWSNYCAERKPQGACYSHAGAHYGCDDHGGIFQNKPRMFRHHCYRKYTPCGAATCDVQGCDQGCATAVESHAPDSGEHPATDDESHHEAEGTAQRYFGAPSQLTAEPEVVTRPVTSKNQATAERWYLPFNWKK